MFNIIDSAAATTETPQLGISELNHAVWLFLFGLTLLAGIASWTAKIGTKKFTKFSMIELIGECALSVSVGMSIFLYCASQNFSELLSVAISVLSAHQATRLVYIIGNAITNYGEKFSPKKKELTREELLKKLAELDEK